MKNYIEFPSMFGINLVKDLAENNLYQVPRSQTIVFKFKLDQFSALKVEAGHSSFYDNQNGTILAWPSNEINGRSITMDTNTSSARVSLQAAGCSWLFYSLGTDITNYLPATIQQNINPDQEYYMCFQNKENKDNGLYVKFSYLI